MSPLELAHDAVQTDQSRGLDEHEIVDGDRVAHQGQPVLDRGREEHVRDTGLRPVGHAVRRASADGHDQPRAALGRDDADRVVAGQGFAPLLAHLAEHQDQSSVRHLGHLGHGADGSRHRGGVRVVGVVEDAKPARELERDEALGLLAELHLGKGRRELRVVERDVERRLDRRDGACAGEGASLTDQRGLESAGASIGAADDDA